MNNQKQNSVRSKSEAKIGDLIFFKTNRRSKINHVGIVTEVLDNDIKFIHASTSKGYYLFYDWTLSNSFVQLNRILK
jgi:cell wall-associated NlpC family hydrolase